MVNIYHHQNQTAVEKTPVSNRRRFMIIAGLVVAFILLVTFIVIAVVASQPRNDEQVAPTTAPTVTTTPTPSPTSNRDPDPTTAAPVPTVVAPTPAPAVTPPASEEDASTYAGLLASLPVSDDQNDGYNRDLFRHWSTAPDGCDIRDYVLAVEATPLTSYQSCNPQGTWVSAYDGVSVTDASELDIDHMVPLAEAWRSGAYVWTDAVREAYANDVGHAGSLVAVTAGSNRSKSDRDPSQWMPSSMDRCVYAVEWMLVKYRWGLTVDPVEQSTLSSWSGDCAGTAVTLPERADGVNTNAGAPPVPAPVEPAQAPAQPAPAQPGTPGAGGNDPQFGSCKDAIAAGYGPYVSGQDPEYAWYRDGDSDGTVCE